MTFPASEWGDHDFAHVFPAQKIKDADGSVYEEPHGWRLLAPRDVAMKNLPSTVGSGPDSSASESP